MKEVVYGYSEGEKNIAYDISTINFVSERSFGRTPDNRESNRNMPKMQIAVILQGLTLSYFVVK